MSTLAVRAGVLSTPTLLRGLEGASPLAYFGPNWFASVMGTGIVSIALAGLPFHLPGAEPVAFVIWLLAVVLLVAVTVATVLHHRWHPDQARRHLDDPVMSHFYGAPAMALMTVGAATALVGHRLIGTEAALAVDAVLWTLGTALGLAIAIVVPYRAITVHRPAPDAAFGGWLIPVVPPMVSAATGALLVPSVPAGQPRETFLLFCYLLFGLALVSATLVIALIWRRLLHHGIGPAAAVPTLWIVLGPMGQSATAGQHLGLLAPSVLPEPYGEGFEAITLVYGVPALGLGLLWLVLVVSITVRTARRRLPFSLAWWSFTFPVGTMVTGSSGLAETTGLMALQVFTGLLLAGLVGAWIVVLVRTLRGVFSGGLLLAPT